MPFDFELSSQLARAWLTNSRLVQTVDICTLAKLSFTQILVGGSLIGLLIFSSRLLVRPASVRVTEQSTLSHVSELKSVGAVENEIGRAHV